MTPFATSASCGLRAVQKSSSRLQPRPTNSRGYSTPTGGSTGGMPPGTNIGIGAATLAVATALYMTMSSKSDKKGVPNQAGADQEMGQKRQGPSTPAEPNKSR